MSRLFSVCLCAVVALVALTGARLLGPAPVLAASGTLSMDTPLHESPAHGAPVIALLPEGTVVSIDGPPVDGFYPVSTGELSGWMRGETMLLEKDVPAEGEDPALAADDSAATGEMVPVEQTAQDGTPPADPAAGSDAQLDPSLTTAPAVETPVADQATTVPVADITAADLAVSPTAPAGTPPAQVAAESPAAEDAELPATDAAEPPVTVAAEPAPVDATASEVAADTAPAATPVADAAASEAPTDEATTEEPAPEPSVTPIPQPTPAPTGPASVNVDAPIRTGPGPRYDLVFTVPGGSTVEQTGHVVDGYVTVQYKEVTGWLALEHIGQPNDFVAETPPAENTQPVDTKTPRPGSGVAFTTVDLSLRAGPGANEEPVAVVPAGSRVVLTGVMEGGFQRVTYQDQIGWVANEYLSTPEDPEPENGNHQSYSRRDIVRIIYDAADQYDQSRSDMLRVAECESNLDPFAVNPSGSYGLFQFIRSTWKSTPFGDEDIFDPYANANAAGWMWAEGRKSEWVCQ